MPPLRIIEFSLDGCSPMQRLDVGPLNIFSSLIKWRVGPGKNNTPSIQSILLLFCRNRVRAVAAATWVCKKIMKTSDFWSNTWLRGEILCPRLNPMSRRECVTRTQRRALTQLPHPRLKEGFWIATYSWCESASTVKREGWKLEECFSLRVGRGDRGSAIHGCTSWHYGEEARTCQCRCEVQKLCAVSEGE